MYLQMYNNITLHSKPNTKHKCEFNDKLIDFTLQLRLE